MDDVNDWYNGFVETLEECYQFTTQNINIYSLEVKILDYLLNIGLYFISTYFPVVLRNKCLISSRDIGNSYCS